MNCYKSTKLAHATQFNFNRSTVAHRSQTSTQHYVLSKVLSGVFCLVEKSQQYCLNFVISKLKMAGTLVKQQSILELTTDALCLAVSTALRLTTPLPPRGENKADLPYISLDQVSWHDNSSDCWVVIYDRVYNVTPFLNEHPGGAEIILEYAGRDATLAFRGSGHSSHAWRALEKYIIGQLPPHEKIFNDGSQKIFENTSVSNGVT